MLTRRQLRELRPERLPLHILELDYVQAVVLRGIYSRDDLVFKGGTCLRKLHGLPRFSEDLDFSLASLDVGEAEARAIVEAGATMMERSGMRVEVKGWRARPGGFLCRLRYEGPLYTGEDLSRGTLQIEMSRVVPLKDPVWTSIASEYVDAGTFLVRAMDPEEMAAEKLRSLRQRRKPRDLLDVWFLLGRGIQPDRAFLAKKLEEVGLESGTTPRQLVEGFDITEDEWEGDLGVLVEGVPDLVTIRREVAETLWDE
ncbi:MAG: nucleotidyl transferase AbiEii/AbiGii toxin family protein [Thermoplasmata archaeon]|nr:nucleotidyl transferase AbiEii/AbiGii toxin family protein [Thermoplasmata archaeon]MCK5415590.1 nucleotidyl transferase AbiEii/AbiGii toxin family protein [Thermoplasmata archaeon]